MGAGFSIVARADSAADIFIYEDIGASWFGGVTAKEFAAALKALGSVQTLNVRINSGGGDVFDGLAIYNQLVQHPAKVVSYVDGLAASIASVIAMAGDEIKVSESGFVMIHNASGIALGDAQEMRTMANLLDKVTGAITDVYADRTKNPVSQLAKWMNEETWFDGSAALDSGFADSLIPNMRVAAYLGEKHAFRRRPENLLTSETRPIAPAAEPAAPTPANTATPNITAARARLAKINARLSLAS